jgi:CHASE2 domain-containing sensor protein
MAPIFLSYDHRDRVTAQKLVDAIESCGLTVWWDQKLPPGKTWDEALEQNLKDADYCIVLCSRSPMKSRSVRKAEMLQALDSCKETIPVTIDGVKPEDLHWRLRQSQTCNLGDWVPGIKHDALDGLLLRLGAPAQPRHAGRTHKLWALWPLALAFAFAGLLLMASGVSDLFGVDSSLRFAVLAVRDLAGYRKVSDKLKLVVIDKHTLERVAQFEGKEYRDYSSAWRALHARALRRLSDAEPAVVAYALNFKELDPGNHPVGTQSLADEIRRTQRTAVVVAANPDENFEPAIRSALRSDAPHQRLPHDCTGKRFGLTATIPLIACKPDSRDYVVSFALTTFAKFRGVSVRPDCTDESDNSIGMDSEADKDRETPIYFAGYEQYDPFRRATWCGAIEPLDHPARYYLDAFPFDVSRGDPSVIPFEDLVQPEFDGNRLQALTAAVKGKIVLVGLQIEGFEAPLRVWDRGPVETWPLLVQANAINTLLSGAFVRRLGALEQLLWLFVLTLMGIALRVGVQRWWLRRALLVALLLGDLALAAIAATFGLLSDVPYHVIFICLSYGLGTRAARLLLRIAQARKRSRAKSMAPARAAASTAENSG